MRGVPFKNRFAAAVVGYCAFAAALVGGGTWYVERQRADRQADLDRRLMAAMDSRQKVLARDLLGQGAAWSLLRRRLQERIVESPLACDALEVSLMYRYEPREDSNLDLPEDASLVRKLLDAGASSSTALLDLAVEQDKRATARLLLQYGAQINPPPGHDDPPLVESAHHGDTEFVTTLLDRGARINAQNSIGETALFLAVWADQIDIARLLIDHGANVNIGSQHLTPIMRAASQGKIEMVKLLLEHHADVRGKDAYGLSIMQLASDSQIRELLKRAGAK